MTLYNELSKNFRDGTFKDMTFNKLCLTLDINDQKSRQMLRSAISALIKDNVVYYDRGIIKLSLKERLKNPFERNKVQTVSGVIRANERGFGFLVTDSGDYYIAPENMGYALNGDRCECAVICGRSGKNDAAVVLKITDHTVKNMAGTFFTEGAFSYVRPDDKNYLADVLITDLNGYNPITGDKVYIELTNFPQKSCPHGKIQALLGRQFELLPEENALILSFGIAEEFPEGVKKAAAKISDDVCEEKLKNRTDLSDMVIFTIDGDTARDYDDAVSLTKDENGNYLLGVHIADVSEYVEFGSLIDKEAYKRGTSVYFPDRVVPMLPFALSSGACSLKEGKLRLTVSVFVNIDDSGHILGYDIKETVIKSAYRLTYNNVQAIFDGDKTLQNKYKDIVNTLFEMKKIKDVLQRSRETEGYIDFTFTEGEIIFDGKNITVNAKKPNDATELIEQFMITANQVVAEHLFYLNLPCIYRVHDKPDREKLQALKDLFGFLGVKVNWRRDDVYPSDYRNITEAYKDSERYPLILKALLRSLKKAVYSTENIGHFGLASKCYCHFTSPIRRYPDLMVHRILKAAINGEIGAITDLYEDFLFESAHNSTERERVFDEAERAVCDLYKVKYMENHIDELFQGIISGITQRGIFVELQNTCEGFVPIELLPPNLEFYEQTYQLRNKKYCYKIGDKMEVFVIGVDIGERKVHFAPAKLLLGHQKKQKNLAKIK